MSVPHMSYSMTPHTYGLFPQEKRDDHQSLCATLIRDGERNKLSSIERSWLAGTM